MQVAQAVRQAELEAVVEEYLVHKTVEVAHKVAVVHTDIADHKEIVEHKEVADHREAAVRMDIADRKVVVARTVAVHKAVSVHKVGKAGKAAWVEEDEQEEVASLVVFLPFPLLPFLHFLLLFLLLLFLLQLALLVEGVEVVLLELVDLRKAVGVVVADKEVAHKVVGVGTVEHKDPWDMADRLVHRAASFLAGHMMAAVRTWVADHRAVVDKVDKAVVDKPVVCKAAVHIARIAAGHMVVCHIAAEVRTDYKAAVARTDHMVAVAVHIVAQMAVVGQIYQPFLVVRIVLPFPFRRYHPASFLALKVKLQTLCS